MTGELDKRRHPYRGDIAAEELRGRVDAERFVAAREYHVGAALADLCRHPRADSPLDTQMLLGECFRVYDIAGEWAWGQAVLDGYVGYVRTRDLREGFRTPTHLVRALRTFFYRDADLKSPVLMSTGMNAKLSVEKTEGSFSRTDEGYVFTKHLAGTETRIDNYVSVAERLLGVPYLWGGRDSLGLDCSALLQLSLEWSGIACPRDTDMQERELGVEAEGFTRGDFVFWRGHVGIMQNETQFLHAEANSMSVTSEPIEQAIRRIRKIEGEIRCIRRLPR
ncbi:MAG: NlpC/P60 family protein [Hyphomicrobiales bacterium]|nr:NlpC/P60 family protein [Hyphomicrobiales bacterium]